jgi:Mrp family chromosome partitioning ATPase
VIVDCAPLLPVADALAGLRWSDALILVARSGSTRRRDLRRAIELVATADADIFGAVLNDVPEEKAGYYGYGGYGSYGGYGGPRTGRHRRSRRRPSLTADQMQPEGPNSAAASGSG